MKSKRFLAMLLSIAMLISSWSLFVLADGDGSPDGDISSGDTEEPGNSLYALKLDEIYEKPVETLLGGVDHGKASRPDALFLKSLRPRGSAFPRRPVTDDQFFIHSFLLYSEPGPPGSL